MRQLVFKDLKVSALYLMLFVLFILATYVFHVNSIGLNMTIILGFLVLLFYFDYHNNVYRSLVSMPLNRKEIVRARYIFLYTFTFVFMLFIGLMDYIALNSLYMGIYLGNFTYLTANQLANNFAIITVLMAIYLPIFYAIKNFSHAMTVFMITHVVIIYTYNMMIGNPYITIIEKVSSFVNPYLNAQPYLIPLLISILAMFLSHCISLWFFTKRDIG